MVNVLSPESGDKQFLDDIYTIGGIIDMMAKVLKEAGVNEGYFVTIAVLGNL